FALPTVGPGVYRVAAVADGYATVRSAEINTDLYDGKPLVLELTTGATATGTVVDDAGKPIAGASVMPLSGIAASRMSGARRSEKVDVDAQSVRTNAEGKFVLERLTTGTEMLRVTHPDYALLLSKELTLDGGENRLDPLVMR